MSGADECKRLARFVGANHHRSGGLRAPIVERVGELNDAASRMLRDMEDGGIRQGGLTPTGFVSDTRGIDCEINTGDGQWRRSTLRHVQTQALFDFGVRSPGIGISDAR